MTKDYRSVPAEEILGKLPEARRSKIKARATELIDEELGSQELKKGPSRSAKSVDGAEK